MVTESIPERRTMDTEDSLAAEAQALETLLHRLQCSAKNCDNAIPDKKWFCERHWIVVPRAIKRRMLEHYHIGQDEPDGFPSKEFLDDIQASIVALEKDDAAILELTKLKANE